MDCNGNISNLISYAEVMALIVIEANTPNFTQLNASDTNLALLKRCFPHSYTDDSVWCIKENIWDCIGDLLICTVGDDEGEDFKIVLKGGTYYKPRYYCAESLVSLYLDIKERGWTITMDNQIDFFLRCPEFDEINFNPTVSSDRVVLCAQKRTYAHPIDSKIIDVLDMPGIRTVFGSAVDMLTDLSYSQSFHPEYRSTKTIFLRSTILSIIASQY